MKFTDFLTESKEGKNVHLEHLEDEILNRGVAGARDAINFLQSLRDMLAGNSKASVKTTTKWDGAPALFAGIDPSDGQFFVAKKGIFNKNAKVYKTGADIDADVSSPDLNNKLKTALRYLPKLGITGVLQGDMMFTKGDIKDENIDGESYAIFQPNTIVYAVPSDSSLAKSMKDAQLGIVFHTSYTGKSFEDMKASFNIDISNLKKTKDVWFRDADFIDTSGTSTFTESETKEITKILSDAGKIFRSINPFVLNKIATTNSLNVDIKTFYNTKVRAGQTINNTVLFVNELVKWVDDKYTKDVLQAKKQDTKNKRNIIRNETMRFYRNYAGELNKIFMLHNDIVKAKLKIVRKLQQMRQVTGTFLKTDSGFKITNPEGFVAVDKIKGNAVKLIDRLEFSQANFNAAKNWS